MVTASLEVLPYWKLEFPGSIIIALCEQQIETCVDTSKDLKKSVSEEITWFWFISGKFTEMGNAFIKYDEIETSMVGLGFNKLLE